MGGKSIKLRSKLERYSQEYHSDRDEVDCGAAIQLVLVRRRRFAETVSDSISVPKTSDKNETEGWLISLYPSNT